MALIELVVIIVIVVIALSLCILLIPFRLSFTFTREEYDTRTEFEVIWLWGLIKKKFEGMEAERVEKELEKKKKKPEKEKKNIIDQLKDGYDAVEYIPVFFELFYHFLKFTKDALFSLKIREIKLRVMMGFPEPHYTGFLAGFLYFIRGLSYSVRINPDIVIEPDFNVPHNVDEMKLDIFLKTVLWVRLINVVVPFLRFILTKPARRLMWMFITKKIKRK